MAIRIITRYPGGEQDVVEWLHSDLMGAVAFGLERAQQLGENASAASDIAVKSVEVWEGTSLSLSIAIRQGGLDPVKAASKLPTRRV